MKIGVTPTTIGLTVVAFGTSLPELVVTSEAFRRGDYSIGNGNVVGSNIANIGLILALVALLMPAVCTLPASRPRLLENSLMTLAATMVFVLFMFRGYFDIFSAVAFLGIFSLLLYLMWRSSLGADPLPDSPARYPLILTIVGLGMVVVGAHLLLTGAVEIALILSVPHSVIGLSLVAVGTSVPELATSTIAAIRKSPGIAVGNILGSNIFNLLFVIGINSLFFTIPVPDLMDVMVMIGFTIAIFPLFIRRICESRIWGATLLVSYALYIALLFGIL